MERRDRSELDGLLKLSSQSGLLVGQFKSAQQQGGKQIREAFEHALVSKAAALKQGTMVMQGTTRIGGLLYAEPTSPDWKVYNNVLECLILNKFSANSTAQPGDLKSVLEAGARARGLSYDEVCAIIKKDYADLKRARPLDVELKATIKSNIKTFTGIDVISLTIPKLSESTLEIEIATLVPAPREALD